MLLDRLIDRADCDRPTLQRAIAGLGLSLRLGFLLLQNTEDAIQQQ